VTIDANLNRWPVTSQRIHPKKGRLRSKAKEDDAGGRLPLPDHHFAKIQISRQEDTPLILRQAHHVQIRCGRNDLRNPEHIMTLTAQPSNDVGVHVLVRDDSHPVSGRNVISSAESAAAA
jgi:hypothetical protein